MVKLGVTLPQFTDDPTEVLEGAQRARDAGLDSVFVFDHLWPLTGGKERPLFESWTTLAYIAATLEEIEIGTLVTRSSLRHPAVLAKMAATVAAIAPGRLIVAIGSGDEMSRPENGAYGIPYYGGDDRVPQMISTADAVRRYVTRKSVSMSDDYLVLDDLPVSPVVHPPKVWLGGRSQPVLDAAGRVGDGWNAWAGTPERFARDAAIVTAAATGREVQLTWGGLVIMADTDDAAQTKLGKRDPKGYLVGSPDTVARTLARFVEAGASHLVVTFTDPAEPSNYLKLGSDVRRLVELG